MALIAAAIPFAASAQDKSPIPAEEVYGDVGRGVGMTWSYQAQGQQHILEFGVKETNHRLDRLWEISCADFKSGSGTVANTIFATPPELQSEDQFGFTIRVDDGKSYGLIGRMDPIKIQGSIAHFPHFEITDSHELWRELRRGNRAFVNLHGNKFSIDLNGSGDAINRFLTACRKNTD